MGDIGWKELGMTAIVFIPFMFLLKWVLQEVSAILKRECEERVAWQNIISNFQISQTQLGEQHRAFMEQVSEAHRFQREEHKAMADEHQQMIETLGRINGYKDHS